MDYLNKTYKNCQANHYTIQQLKLVEHNIRKSTDKLLNHIRHTFDLEGDNHRNP